MTDEDKIVELNENNKEDSYDDSRNDFGFTQEETHHLFDFIENLADKILRHYDNKTKVLEAPIKRATLYGFFIIVGGIILGSMLLVYHNKMDASNLSLIIGIVLGYLFSMAKTFLGVYVKKEET
ncbi:MAG: hypothetical protein LBU81_01530 [Methanosarcinales archaeon]|jgi:hypothetical protein|nr:hypothetical protein [Methanosarcinales archaeon]